LAGRMTDGEPPDEPVGALAVASDGEQVRTAPEGTRPSVPAVMVVSVMGAPGILATTSGKEPAGAAPGWAEASVVPAAAYGGGPIGAAALKPRGGPSVPLVVARGTRPIGAVAPRRKEQVTPLAAACGARPIGVAAPTLVGVPVKEEELTGKGTQSISDRKSNVDEGGAEISTNGKEASSNVTCHNMMRRLDARSRH
jgi:hypothetical protein